MQFLNKINKIKEINKNQLARLQQKKVLFIAIGIVGALIFLCSFFVSSPKNAIDKPKVPDMTGAAATSEFTGTETSTALQEQVGEVETVKKQMTAMKNQVDSLEKVLIDNTNSNTQALQNLQAKLDEFEGADKTKETNGKQISSHAEAIMPVVPTTITTVSFSYEGETKVKNPMNYVPPGTFAQAVLLSGADANAGVTGQTDTVPVTMRILNNGTLPNGKHSSLKGCFVTAAVYGDASSERGQIRLQRLSCVREGRIIDVAVEGTVNDMGGSDGIRGHPVMRNGKMLWNAGFSGVLSGIGSAAQQSLTTQSISPLGSTNSVPPGKVFEYGAYGGANTALSKLADYYIKLANLYHPIIQIHAGSEVNIVFLKGFALDEGVIVEQNVSFAPPKVSTENIPQPSLVIPPTPENLQKLSSIGQYSPENLPQRQVLPDLKNAQLGQTIKTNEEAL